MGHLTNLWLKTIAPNRLTKQNEESICIANMKIEVADKIYKYRSKPSISIKWDSINILDTPLGQLIEGDVAEMSFTDYLKEYLLDLVTLEKDQEQRVFGNAWDECFGEIKQQIRYIDHGIPKSYPYVAYIRTDHEIVINWFDLDILIDNTIPNIDPTVRTGFYNIDGDQGCRLVVSKSKHRCEWIHDYENIAATALLGTINGDLKCLYMKPAYSLFFIDVADGPDY